MAVSINLSIQDEKGAISTTSFNVPDGLTTLSYQEMALAVVSAVLNLITGGIVNAQICLGVDLSGIVGVGIVDPGSDVEEGGRFVWDSFGGFKASNRIATFNEALIVAGSRIVNPTLAEVADFIDLIVDGVTTTDDGLQQFTDYREADILALESARESFQRSRK